jgi:tetratricopeptide (TPR) repeat protein
MRTYKKILFSAIILVLVFSLAELTCRIFIFPGSYDYIERRIIEHNLAQNKKSGEFRIFLYGESTMHGGALYPYSVIGNWLKIYLEDLLPEDVMRRVTIVNFGRMGTSSTFIATAFAETINYKPDMAVFYTVHNDFCLVEYRLALVSKKSFKKTFRDFCQMLPKKSSFLNLLNRLIISAKIAKNKILGERLAGADPWYVESAEPEAFLENANLLRPGSRQLMLLEKNFGSNVDKIIETAQRHAIPIIFFEGLSRWKDYEPIKSVHSAALTGDMLSGWGQYFSEAEDLFARKEYNKALALYSKCMDIDPEYALTYYRVAECYEHLGRPDKANEHYTLANDNDYFPIRAPSFVNRFYENVRTANIKGVDVIRTQKLIEENSPDGIVDESLTIDQIHPSPEGQALMALEIVKAIYKNNSLAPREKWQWNKMRSINEIKKTLGLNSGNMFHVYTGTASYLAKHYRKAAQFLEKALIIKPKSVFVRSWLAWTYWKMGNIEKAVFLYRELYRERPSLASAFFKNHPDIEEALGVEH